MRNKSHLALFILIVVLGSRPAESSDAVAEQPFAHVRTEDAVLRKRLGDAIARSLTFRMLVDDVQATNGIVYIVSGGCRHGRRACLSLSIVTTGGYRFLRVYVDRRRAPVELIADIGHELQHAVEVLSETSVSDGRAAYLFYSRRAPTTEDTFETSAAQAIERAILNELDR
jgi:hypothetical protein